jgi:hypothetical protein
MPSLNQCSDGRVAGPGVPGSLDLIDAEAETCCGSTADHGGSVWIITILNAHGVVALTLVYLLLGETAYCGSFPSGKSAMQAGCY